MSPLSVSFINHLLLTIVRQNQKQNSWCWRQMTSHRTWKYSTNGGENPTDGGKPYYEPAVSFINHLLLYNCSLPVWRQVQILTCNDLVVVDLALRSYFYRIRKLLLSISLIKMYFKNKILCQKCKNIYFSQRLKNTDCSSQIQKQNSWCWRQMTSHRYDCSLPVWRQVQILTCDDLVVVEKFFL
jgi:hypothetical protein